MDIATPSVCVPRDTWHSHFHPRTLGATKPALDRHQNVKNPCCHNSEDAQNPETFVVLTKLLAKATFVYAKPMLPKSLGRGSACPSDSRHRDPAGLRHTLRDEGPRK